jgi:formylglycine-generating enzyme required for sulfatase activity
MNIKNITVAALAAMTTATLTAAVPEVSNATMTQAADRLVTITYTLADAPAVITLDIQTNNTQGAWASIGGANIQNLTGDVWKKVETGNHTIQWRPDLSWPDHKIADGGARAVVTAWALDNTPDYMVVDISAAAQPNTQKYYPSVEFLPGGLLGNDDYRTTKLVMRKIMAKNVTWTMGSTALESLNRNATREATHQVTLDNNFYIGVFEVTQDQWALIQIDRPTPAYYNNASYRSMRPVEQVSYNEIRNAANSATANTAYDWPNDPNPGSFLGLLRTKTGIDFDLPSEAQWEFAARAGNGSTKWGNGSGIVNTDTDGNLNSLGRYQRNGGKPGSSDPAASVNADNATAIVGSYSPNDWGLYDMHGNVWEWCLDWREDDITSFNGRVNIDSSDPSKTLSGVSGSGRVGRGGAWNAGAGYCRPAYRDADDPSSQRLKIYGFRVLCTAGLQ